MPRLYHTKQDLTHSGPVIPLIWFMLSQYVMQMYVNTPRQKRNGHFGDDILKCIFFNENVWIMIKITLKFVPKCPINNIPALIQTMAWHRPGDKPLSESMMVSLPMHICITRPQWVENVSFWGQGVTQGHLSTHAPPIHYCWGNPTHNRFIDLLQENNFFMHCSAV